MAAEVGRQVSVKVTFWWEGVGKKHWTVLEKGARKSICAYVPLAHDFGDWSHRFFSTSNTPHLLTSNLFQLSLPLSLHSIPIFVLRHCGGPMYFAPNTVWEYMAMDPFVSTFEAQTT